MASTDYQVDRVDDFYSDCDFLVPDILASSCEDDGWSPPLYKPPAYTENLNNRNGAALTNLQELFQFQKLTRDEQSSGALAQSLDLEETEDLKCCLPSRCKHSVRAADSKSCVVLASGRQEIAPILAQPGATICVQSNRTNHVSLVSVSGNVSPRTGGTLHIHPDYMSTIRKGTEATSSSLVESDASYAFEDFPTSASAATEFDSLSDFQQCVASIPPTVISNRQFEGMEGLISGSCCTISSNNEALEDDGAYTGNTGMNTWYSHPVSGVVPPDFSTEDAFIPTVSFSTSASARSDCGSTLNRATSQFGCAWTLNSENCKRYMPMTTKTEGALESIKGRSVQVRANENCWSSRYQQENFMPWSNMKISNAQNVSLGAAEISPSTRRSLQHLKSENRACVPPCRLPSNRQALAGQPLPCEKEMLYRAAALRPVEISSEAFKRPKRRNVKISKEPQSVAARHRRERISEKISILQRLVPGGTKMDTASMLDEAVQYLKFLKMQVHAINSAAARLYPSTVTDSMLSNYTNNSNHTQPSSSSDALSCLRAGQSSGFLEAAQPSSSSHANRGTL